MLLGVISNNSRTDSHVTRTPLVLDEQGWNDLKAVLNETLERANAIEDEAVARLSKSKGESMNTKLAILHFESPSE